MFACVMIRGARSAPQDYATEKTLLDALTPYDQDDVRGAWSNDRMLMVQALTWNTPQSRHETTPEVCATSGRVIVSWVRLDNRTDLCAALGLSDSKTLTDPRIILAAYAAWGDACADRLEGDFSFVIYDPATDRTFCARDSIGAKPFFYYVDERVFIAGTTAAVFPVLRTLSLAPSRDWIVRFAMCLPHVMTESAYENVARLAPAHSLMIARDGAADPHEYFAFKDTAPMADTRDPKYLKAYRDAFHRATETRLRSDFLVGAENSGGLDSVSIMGHAVKHLPHDMEGFHCFGLPTEKRTQELILEASTHANVRHTHLATHMTALGDYDSFDRAIKTLGYPVEHSQINLHLSALRQSESLGIRTMLSGYGGDEIVTQQAKGLGLELINNGQFKTLLNQMPGNAVSRRLRYFKRVRNLKQNAAYTAKFSSIMKRTLAHSPVRREVVEDLGIPADYDARVAHSAGAETLNDQILRDIAFSQCRVGRLEACSLMAQSHRVEYRWPLFDRQLIQSYLRAPALEKRHKSMGRYLHRRAVAGSIPHEIVWQQSKDMGNIIWDGFNTTLPDLLEEASVSPHLSSVLDFEKLRKTHAGVQQAQGLHQHSIDGFLQERVLWTTIKLAHWLGS